MRFSELDGKRIGVWGAGREIRSFAAQVARRLPGARIAVAAFDAPPDAATLAELGTPAPQVVVGGEAVDALRGCDAVVRSPGVSIHRPELEQLCAAGVPVATATGLWIAERGGRGVIGVTGTKGKSTTSALVAHLLRTAGVEASLAGNIGVPALDLLDAPPERPAVVELSSYQVADLAVGPQVAVVTNLFPEHVDWHGSDEAYRAEKLRLLTLPGVERAVVNARDARIGAAVGAGVAVTAFGAADGWDVVPTDGPGKPAAGASVTRADDTHGGEAVVARGGEAVVALRELPLPGAHNALNLCAALAALEAFGAAPPPLPGALRGFRGLPHRLELVAEHGGVAWVDDSISTTPESALAALASFPDRDVVLIGGGQDRRQDYDALARALAARGAAVIGLPSTGGRLVAAARRAGVPGERALDAADLEGAVWHARELAREGGVVLLSPAAPSYGAYRDFEERGDHFRALASRAA